MASPSPYRAAPGRIPGTTIFFLPQFRIYFAPIVVVLAIFFVSVAPTPTREDHVGCRSELDPRNGELLHAACEIGRGRGCESEPGRICGRAVESLDALLGFQALQSTIVYGGRNFMAPIEAKEARAALGRCLPSAPPESGSYLIPDSVGVQTRWSCATVQRRDLRVPLAIALLALCACLAFFPSRLVRVQVDPRTLAVRADDRALYRRARGIDCALDDIREVVLHEGRVCFVLRSGERVALSGSDRRPIELQRRTVARLGRFVAAAQERFGKDGGAGEGEG